MPIAHTTRTLFISPPRAEAFADTALRQGKARYAEIVPGRVREDDGTVSQGWFAKLYPAEGAPFYA